MRRKTWFRSLAAIALVTLVGAACGQSTEEAVDDASPAGQELAADPFADLRAADQVLVDNAAALSGGIAKALKLDGSTESPASNVLTSLEQLLQEHVYFAGIAVDTAYSFGADGAAFDAAGAALDQNSVALADLVGSVDESKRDPFLELWRQHIGFFVDYAVAAKGGDEAGKQAALDELAQYREQSGAFFEELSGGVISADAVKAELIGHVQTLTAAIDAFAAGTTDAFDKLKASADQIRGAAGALAGGIVQATGMEGSTNSAAATTRATLTKLLQEHGIVAGIAVKTAFATSPDSDMTQAALATLDKNSVALADVIGGIDESKRDPFLELWRQHIGFFVDYALGAAGGDEEAKQKALEDLEQYGVQAGAFFEELSGGVITPDAVKQNLARHVDTLSKAIDSLAAVVAA